ncbi:hypothetical protein V7075_02690 [Neobacillus drentensis]|uniref:hypothetical protein n=1 Tax=Neobacillus drentensis TaxID=220684 RepID=UPI0030000D2C
MEGESYRELLEKVATFQIGETFKVMYVKNGSVDETFEKRRAMEKEVGLHINGVADYRQPKRLFGVMNINGRSIFGDYVKSESVWYQHQQNPHNYSTALSTRVGTY